MNVTIDPDVSFLIFCEGLEKILDIKDLWMELSIRIDPLTVEVNSCDRISVISTDNAVWVKDWDQYEGVELA